MLRNQVYNLFHFSGNQRYKLLRKLQKDFLVLARQQTKLMQVTITTNFNQVSCFGCNIPLQNVWTCNCSLLETHFFFQTVTKVLLEEDQPGRSARPGPGSQNEDPMF
ncbi:F6U3 [Hyposoter didymator ichnovirus]|nr:F6U3 [Hyposoter didymator ichnovirus]